MIASLEFEATFKGLKFPVRLQAEIADVAEGELSLEMAKELLVQLAINLTNSEGFEQLARDLAAPPKSVRTLPGKARLTRIK